MAYRQASTGNIDPAIFQGTNPLKALADYGQAYYDKKDERARLLAADAREQAKFDMQKQQYADAQAAKVAGAEYLNAIRQSTDKALTTQQDAEFDDKILNAPDTGKPLTPQEVAAFKAELSAAQEKTRKDPLAMMGIAQGVAVPANINAESASTMLGRVLDPYEKQYQINETHRLATDRDAAAHKKALEVAGLQHKNAMTQLEHQAQLTNDKTSYVRLDDKGNVAEVLLGRDLGKRTPEEQQKFMTVDAWNVWEDNNIAKGKNNEKATVGLVLNEDGDYDYAKPGDQGVRMFTVGDAEKLVKSSGKSGGSSNGSGGKASKTDVLSTITTEYAPKFDLFGKGDGEELIANSKYALALGVPPAQVKQMAEEASFTGSGWLGNRKADTDFYNTRNVTIVTKEGLHVPLGDAIEAAKIKGIDITKNGYVLSNKDIKDAVSAKNATSDEYGTWGSAGSTTPVVKKTQGMEMGNTLEQQNLLNAQQKVETGLRELFKNVPSGVGMSDSKKREVQRYYSNLDQTEKLYFDRKYGNPYHSL